MKNKFNETGSDFGNLKCLSKSHASECDSRKGLIEKLKADWPDPEGSKELIVWLLKRVNYEEEYEGLQQELADIELLISLTSSKTKGGTA